MYPHERSLVERMHGKPFVLLGINSDETRERLKEVIESNNITWRSWWEGPNLTISTRWNVQVWPTIYVLDRKGVIRFESKNLKELDEGVETLLREN